MIKFTPKQNRRHPEQTMTAQQKSKSEHHVALGAALLCLRGATENLIEALPTKNDVLIIKRRIELSEIILSLNRAHHILHEESLTKRQLVLNINEALAIAVAILHDASSYLSARVAAA